MFESVLTNGMSFSVVALCLAVSLAAGAVISFSYLFRNAYSKNFALTLFLMPAVVQAVIMLVNGNIGTGVAIMGAFSLVRFRSVPGNSRDILFIFFAMAAGLAAGSGQLVFAAILTASVCGIIVIIKLFHKKSFQSIKRLKITVPEDLDYETELRSILDNNVDSYTLVKTKTASMGSMFVLDYSVKLKPQISEKKLIDKIRVINGNLPISLGMEKQEQEEL